MLSWLLMTRMRVPALPTWRHRPMRFEGYQMGPLASALAGFPASIERCYQASHKKDCRGARFILDHGLENTDKDREIILQVVAGE